jgi:lipopolysaccharide export system permease protein
VFSLIWSILHRTIFFELARIFLLSLIGITGMLLMAGIVAEASQRGLSPMQILAAIPLLVPSTLPYTIPATTLFATCVVYGRLAADNEILAIKAAGINVLSVVGPAILLGVAMTVLTVALYYDLIPTTHHIMRAMVVRDIEEFLYRALKWERCINYPKMNYRMQVKGVQGRTLLAPVLVSKNPKTGAEDAVVVGTEAELHVDLAQRLIILHMRGCTVTGGDGNNNGYLGDKEWPIELPVDFDKVVRKSGAGDMTWNELVDNRNELQHQRQIINTEINLWQSLSATPKANPDHLKNLISESRSKQDVVRNIETEMMMRPALALGCLCFVLVGCPVGIWFSKSDYLSAFITCFLPIVFVYYPLLLCGQNLAKSGKIQPAIAVWLADAIVAVVALPLYRKLLKN